MPCSGNTILGTVAMGPRAAGAWFSGRWGSALEQVEIERGSRSGPPRCTRWSVVLQNCEQQPS